ncbi:hypothetical protein T03_15259 [Trichinella britovi]|uniref:Uncharacterized protein n=2 Tax=Trichinella britovi TaxID=45882 RepID=A0A0V1CLI3_TRIBR|nr:hypothetical protein T03_15259 [Trichinella britovi]
MYRRMELYSILSRARVYFLFPWLLLKSHHPSSFFPISRQIRVHTTCDQRFWKVLRQINPYVSNKWPLKLPCAYLNTQQSRHTGTPLKWNMGG